MCAAGKAANEVGTVGLDADRGGELAGHVVLRSAVGSSQLATPANATPVRSAVRRSTTSDELLEEYPQLSADDIREALRFAAAHADQRTIALDHST